jgi:hypothetical protein
MVIDDVVQLMPSKMRNDQDAGWPSLKKKRSLGHENAS